MKLKSDYKITAVVALLLMCLSIVMSTVNYKESLDLAHDQLKYQSLSISLNNIYSEIEKNLIEPYLVSSVMASDTFLKEWLESRSPDKRKIKNYLASLKKRHGLFLAFLVSERDRSYYTHNGFLEILNPDKRDNRWYYRFIDTPVDFEFNLDYNKNIDKSPILFINYKIKKDGKLLGVTGVGLKMSRLVKMLERSKKIYKVNVRIFRKDGMDIIGDSGASNVFDNGYIRERRSEILSGVPFTLEYTDSGTIHIVNVRYISKIGIYILTDASVDDFTSRIKRTFYINILLSVFAIIFIALVLVSFIKKYSGKLELMAENDELTGAMNRRGITKQLRYFMKLYKRNKLSLSVLFMDLDNFKSINDIYGHNTGDEVLKRVGEFFRENTRESDLVARWGGEEFIIVFVETDLDESIAIAEKLRVGLESDSSLIDMLDKPVTGSFGLTDICADDDLDSLIHRADQGMYEAKQRGKNRVVVVKSDCSESTQRR